MLKPPQTWLTDVVFSIKNQFIVLKSNLGDTGATALSSCSRSQRRVSDVGRLEAVGGCKYGLHVASPFPPNIQRAEEELIIPARQGTLRLLRAARDAGRGKGQGLLSWEPQLNEEAIVATAESLLPLGLLQDSPTSSEGPSGVASPAMR
jgi:hypothetical protein